MRHFLDGVEITPRNVGEIGVTLDFTERMSELEVNVTTITLARESYEIVKNHITNKGIFEGIPYTVITSSGKTIEYFVDLTKKPVFKSFEVDVSIFRYRGKDSFMNNANASSFAMIANNGVSFASFDCPYIIVKDNQAELALTLAISLYILGKELIEQTKVLVGSITDLIGAVTPNVGTGVTMDIGDIIGLVLKVVAQIAYVALLITSVIKLGQQLFELMFPKIRFLKGVKVKELLLKGCNFLGYTFNSTLLDSISGLTIMPVPLRKQSKKWFDFFQNELNQSFNLGYPTAQDSTPTLGSLITAIEMQFNAKTRVIDGVVSIERRDYWQTITANNMNVALNIQDNRDNQTFFNTDEAWKRYFITYTPDITDLHTYDDFEGNDAEYSCEPLSNSDVALVTIAGLNTVDIPFALGKRKETLNWLEKRAKELFEKVDEVANFFGGNSSLVSKIENRKGVLMISQQYFSRTKMLYTIGGKQPQNYLNFIRASELWNKYHSINQIQLNGHKVHENNRVVLSDENFVNLINNNFAEIDGKLCEILKVEYIDVDTSETANQTTYATISYKEPFDYATGKVKTLTINS